MQQLAAEVEFFLPETIGQETEVADALKAGRQGVEEKAADELLAGDGQGFRLLLFVRLAVVVSGLPAGVCFADYELLMHTTHSDTNYWPDQDMDRLERFDRCFRVIVFSRAAGAVGIAARPPDPASPGCSCRISQIPQCNGGNFVVW